MLITGNLNMESCYKICEVPPPDGQCGICLAPFIPSAPDEHNTVVKTKVCDHYFHKDCIDAWFQSATPNLNVCPLDRLVLYGVARVPQTPVNVPGWAPFPGHNVYEHDAVNGLPDANARIGMTHGANDGLGFTFGALSPEHDFLNPGLTDFFSGDNAAQPSQGTNNAQNASAESSQGAESQSSEPYLPNGFRTMPGDAEDSREMRRWGW